MLYANGSRNFWIHGTGALGCLPQKLSIARKNDSDIDQNGCLKTYNRAAVSFNAALGSLCNDLNVQLKNATVVYTDLFAIKYDLVANHTKYGELINYTNSLFRMLPRVSRHKTIACSFRFRQAVDDVLRVRGATLQLRYYQKLPVSECDGLH
jgi:hypothetical protein